MKILYLAHRMPYPPNKGDKIRSFHELKFLSCDHEINLAFLIDDPADLAHLVELQHYSATIDYAVINPRLQRLKSATYLFTSAPLTLPYFYCKELQNAIDRRLDVTDIDAIFCYSSPMAQYVFQSRHFGTGKFDTTRLIMDFVDVDSDKWRMYSGFSRYPFSSVYRREWRLLQQYDARVGVEFDHSIFVSDPEVELFRSFCSGSSTVAIANGVDIDFFATVEQMRRGGRSDRAPTILFMGAMDYFPNEDAATYFAEEVMPLVHQGIPEARFVIVGSNPTNRVVSLQRTGRVKVTGRVPDVRPFLADADIFVAPLRIARGIQNKVLEAMAAGLPVVARPEAVQGFGKQRAPLLVENSAEGFASAVVELLREAGKREEMTRAAAQFIRQGYTWDNHMAKLTGLLC